jgi:formylglycine-generating enzyme required for sulfatase activity
MVVGMLAPKRCKHATAVDSISPGDSLKKRAFWEVHVPACFAPRSSVNLCRMATDARGGTPDNAMQSGAAQPVGAPLHSEPHWWWRVARLPRRTFVLAGLIGAVAIGLVGGWWSHRSEQFPRPSIPVLSNSIGQRFVWIPPGQFLMGAPDEDRFAEPDERPQHKVRLTKGLWLGQFEVTQAEYERVIGTNPSHFSDKGQGRGLVAGQSTAEFPVEMVSWFDAAAFCTRLSSLPEERAAGRTYRLPSEAEWEYACRAGTTTRFSCGETLSLDSANVKGRWQRTRLVGCYPPNPWGLFDLHGNVLEWCADWHTADYYDQSPAVDPPGPETSFEDVRVLRGGGWFFKAASSSFRDAISPYFKSPAHGFRVVCEVTAPGPISRQK